MIVKNYNNARKQNIFLVLVPHRDSRSGLQKYSEALFSTGLAGVYPFPCAAPLASLSHPLDSDELKNFAKRLREAAGTGKFSVIKTSSAAISINDQDMTLFGPGLDFEAVKEIFINGAETEKIKYFISPVLTGAFIIPKKNEQEVLSALQINSIKNISLPKISFRAAAVANMFWKPVKIIGETCYKWKIEKLYWLPKTIT